MPIVLGGGALRHWAGNTEVQLVKGPRGGASFFSSWGVREETVQARSIQVILLFSLWMEWVE